MSVILMIGTNQLKDCVFSVNLVCNKEGGTVENTPFAKQSR